MDPQRQFCQNPDGPDRGQRGRGNIGVPSQRERRYRCRTCGRTFAATKGMPYLSVTNGRRRSDDRADAALS
jgi:transposase-like protein